MIMSVTGKAMLLRDHFDLPVTCASSTAVEDYVAAVDLLLSAWPGAEARLDRALAADPDFALAHIARARLLQLRAKVPDAKEAAARAQSLANRVTARERRHIEAIALSINGAASDALAMVRAHASEYPRDALPLSLALGVFGLLGFSGRRDHHEEQLALLEALAPRWGDDWWFLGYLGWAYIETGEVAKGTRLVERSLAGNRRNAHAAHQRVHGFFEAGDTAGGAGFIENWLTGYDRVGHLHCHLSWHLALFELARGNVALPRDLPRRYQAVGGTSSANAGPCGLGIVSVALAVLWCCPVARGRRGRGGRTCAAPFPARRSRFRRSPRRSCRSRDRRRTRSAVSHRRVAEPSP